MYLYAIYQVVETMKLDWLQDFKRFLYSSFLYLMLWKRTRKYEILISLTLTVLNDFLLHFYRTTFFLHNNFISEDILKNLTVLCKQQNFKDNVKFLNIFFHFFTKDYFWNLCFTPRKLAVSFLNSFLLTRKIIKW